MKWKGVLGSMKSEIERNLLETLRGYDAEGNFDQIMLSNFRTDQFTGVIGTFFNNFPMFFPVSTYPRYQLAISQPNCTNWELGSKFNDKKSDEEVQIMRSRHTEKYWKRTLGEFINDIREALIETVADNSQVNWDVVDEVDQYLLYIKVAYTRAQNQQELDERDIASLEHMLRCYKLLRNQGYSNYDLTG